MIKLNCNDNTMSKVFDSFYAPYSFTNSRIEDLLLILFRARRGKIQI